jgi:gas vesicle protein
MENSKNTGKIIVSLVLGALAGAALGLLFAPEKGSKTRQKIADDAEKMANDFKKKVKRQAKGLKKSMKEEAMALKNKAAKLENYVENKVEKEMATLKNKAETLLHMNSDHTAK